jgi:hypothetical protein
MKLMTSRKIPIFISVGTPHNPMQELYFKNLIKYLNKRGIHGETLGRSFGSIRNPLKETH